MEELLRSEGVVFHIPKRIPKTKPKVELVITRVTFKQKVKTFWWGLRAEGGTQVMLGGRLGVTSMQAAVRAARHFTMPNYKIARTIRENIDKLETALEEWNGVI